MDREKILQASLSRYGHKYQFKTREAFERGARWMEEQMIEKACEWWSKHATEYLIDIEPSSYKPPRYIISLQAKIDFVKAMKGE